MAPQGRPAVSYCRCDKCNGMLSTVVQSCLIHDGRRVRRRRCSKCRHIWYTVQSPEEKISGQGLVWGGDGSIVSLPARPELPEKEKI